MNEEIIRFLEYMREKRIRKEIKQTDMNLRSFMIKTSLKETAQ